jgi:leucyl-tRNA synthetase
MLGQQGFAIETAWPQYADALAIESEAKLAVQVNGKLRGIIHAARNASEAAIRAQALALPPVAKHVENRTINPTCAKRGGSLRHINSLAKKLALHFW